MAVLHNRVSQAELKMRLLEEKEHRITISFYQYFHIDNPQAFRDELYKNLNALKVFGRIYVAHEGINAQLSARQQLPGFTGVFTFNCSFKWCETEYCSR